MIVEKRENVVYICSKCGFKHLTEPVPFTCENGGILCDECKPIEEEVTPL